MALELCCKVWIGSFVCLSAVDEPVFSALMPRRAKKAAAPATASVASDARGSRASAPIDLASDDDDAPAPTAPTVTRKRSRLDDLQFDDNGFDDLSSPARRRRERLQLQGAMGAKPLNGGAKKRGRGPTRRLRDWKPRTSRPLVEMNVQNSPSRRVLARTREPCDGPSVSSTRRVCYLSWNERFQ